MKVTRLQAILLGTLTVALVALAIARWPHPEQRVDDALVNAAAEQSHAAAAKAPTSPPAEDLPPHGSFAPSSTK